MLSGTFQWFPYLFDCVFNQNPVFLLSKEVVRNNEHISPLLYSNTFLVNHHRQYLNASLLYSLIPLLRD